MFVGTWEQRWSMGVIKELRAMEACKKQKSRYQLSVMGSRDVSRDPFLRVSVSKVSRLISVSKTAGVETFHIGRKWHRKIYIIQRFFVCCICR